ncbi:MAG: DNA repair protein RadC [Muribaculaceae bacterium]|nr:DNA repair protein RadC [Muribaculaceae bacterium]
MDNQLKEPENRFSGRIADLDEGDKPREKALTQGIRSLSNAELLAIIFGSGLPGKSVISMSQEVLASCNYRLSRLSRMSILEMKKSFKGIGTAKAISLAAAFELGLRTRDEDAALDPQIKCSTDIYNMMRAKLERLEYEEFWVLYLSRSNRVIYEECMSKGGVSGTVTDVRLILKRAIELLASGIILVHNHPSGNLRPSPDDDRITTKAKEAAKLLDINVLDHLIITPTDYFSYNDNGRL